MQKILNRMEDVIPLEGHKYQGFLCYINITSEFTVSGTVNTTVVKIAQYVIQLFS